MSSPPTSSPETLGSSGSDLVLPVGREEVGPRLHEEDGSSRAMPLPPRSAVRRSSDAGAGSVPDSGAEVDPRLVQETQEQIKSLVDEIVQLAKQDLSVSEFYQGFATRCVSALSSIGAAVWLKQRQALNLEQQINLAQTGLPQEGPGAYQHDRLLKRIFQDGQPTLVLPSTVNSTDDSGNPTPLLLILAPIQCDGQVVGLIEIFQRPVAGPVTQRGYLRFLVQMAEVAGQYHRNRRLRELDEKQNLWGRLDQFLRCVHESLDVKQTAYNLANEGRRLVECDRVSVALAEGTKLKVLATSGLDRVHRRADQIRLMEQLTTVVCRAKQPLFYVGPTEELPPQIEQCLEEYLDLSHSKAVAIVPLVHAPPVNDDQTDLTKARQAAQVKKKLLGALIIEQLGDQRIPEEKSNRIELVTRHGAAALANALEHQSVFLLPLWQAMGKLSWLTAPANLPKTGLATAAIVIAALVMVLLPYSFTMSARGIIQPVQRHEVYAQTEGLVTEIPLPNQQNVMVQAGQRLIATTNRDLDAEYLSLIGKMEETKELFQEKERSERLLTDRLEKMKVSAEIQLLGADYNTMWERAKIVLDKREQLNIDSPLDGQIINWNLRQTLMGRWLLGGERLMTVVDLNGPWELELYLPERGAVHVLRQVRESETPVEVTFQLASHPGQTYRGTIAQVDQRAEVHEVHGNSIRVLVRFDDQQVPEFLRRPGTGVTAKIHCGQRPLGYVLFREVWETVQAQVLFWL